MSTPHIAAKVGEIAKTILMPGDPLRAKFISENYIESAKQINAVRGMLGYTGTYKGKPVTIMGSGMGIPSIGIYSFELFTKFEVENIIRIGSCGAYSEDLDLYDVILCTEAYSESTYAKHQNGYESDVIAAGKLLTDKLRESAKKLGAAIAEGRVHSSDIFYHSDKYDPPYWKTVRDGKACIAVEMESFGLFHNANVTGKNAACILTVSDLLFDHGKITSAEEREKSFTSMIDIALGTL